MDRHYVVTRVRKLAATAATLLVLSWSLLAASTAHAALPASISPTYSGWTFAIGTSSVDAYKWSSTGWQRASITPGMSMYAQPLATGWNWAYRNGTWYAVRTTSLAPWTCTSAPSAPRVTTRGVQAYTYNNKTTHIGGVAPGTTFYLICSNAIPDATGAEVYVGGGCYQCGGMTPVSYQLAWLYVGGRWTKVYLDSAPYCSLEECHGPPPAAG